jgi:hypothetical protein
MKWLIVVILASGLAAFTPTITLANHSASLSYQPLPKPGQRITLDAHHYFIYGFDKSPKVGTSILRVEIFTRDGRRDTSFTVRADADMPSMRGAHASGDRDFALSNKGVFLLPVNLVMPGDWEVKLTILQNGKPVLGGLYRFDL